MQLSANFTLAEFTRSQAASRNNWSNIPPSDSIPAIQNLVTQVLQPAREHFKKPMNINSGYRSVQVNTAIGGSKTSQHVWTKDYAAADIEVFGVSTVELARWIRDHAPYDQLICEYYDPSQGLNSGWVHVSLRTDGKNRKEVLTIQPGNKSAPGLPE